MEIINHQIGLNTLTKVTETSISSRLGMTEEWDHGQTTRQWINNGRKTGPIWRDVGGEMGLSTITKV